MGRDSQGEGEQLVKNPCLPTRYALLTKETWPHWRGDVKQGVQHVLRYHRKKNIVFFLKKKNNFFSDR